MDRIVAAMPPSAAEPPVELTVVAPAHNEEGNVEGLVREIEAALSPVGIAFECVIVDDGSTDSTRQRVIEAAAERPWLRCVAMTRTPEGRGGGQSAAFHAGFRAARGGLIASLDADLQNDPADLPALLEALRKTGADMVQGDRSRARQDNLVRRVGSKVGRLFRRLILGDRIRDTGCSLRIMRREVALALPLEFAGMHRFIPASAAQMGWRIVEVPVNHRPRVAGETKYGLGISKRALPGLADCFAARWMARRRRPVEAEEVVHESPGVGLGGAAGDAAASEAGSEPLARSGKSA